jgi:hypothetical protein
LHFSAILSSWEFTLVDVVVVCLHNIAHLIVGVK